MPEATPDVPPADLTAEEREAISKWSAAFYRPDELHAAVARIAATRLAAERAEWAGRVEALAAEWEQRATYTNDEGERITRAVGRGAVARELRAALAQSAATEPGTAGERTDEREDAHYEAAATDESRVRDGLRPERTGVPGPLQRPVSSGGCDPKDRRRGLVDGWRGGSDLPDQGVVAPSAAAAPDEGERPESDIPPSRVAHNGPNSDIAAPDEGERCRFGPLETGGTFSGERFCFTHSSHACTVPDEDEPECTGVYTCAAPLHVHGCYADTGNCDYLDHHPAAPSVPTEDTAAADERGEG